MPKKRRKPDNTELKHRTLTAGFHAVYEAEVSERIHAAALKQIAIRNLTTEYLIEHGPTPLRVTPATPEALWGLYQEWRKTTAPWLEGILQAIWRPAVEDAATSYNAWEDTNYEHCVEIARAADEAKTAEAEATKARGRRTKRQKAKQADKEPKGIPRHVQRRRPEPKTLFTSRHERDREHRHTVRIAERVQVIDSKTIKLPEIGTVRLKEPIPEGMDVRSATLSERTPGERGRRVAPDQRSWEVKLAYRKPARLRELPEPEDIRSAGIDHGSVHAMTVSRHDGTSEHIHYPEPKPASVREWNRACCRKVKCKVGSRRWRKLTAKQGAIRHHENNRRKEYRIACANRIALSTDILGIEKLENANMQRSAAGTNEQPGRNVAAKQGLNRRLRDTAPGYQTKELERASNRHGTRYFEVPAPGTSITCSACTHRAKENRESQAGFLCRKCGHAANADVNSGHNIRLTALTHYGVAVERSPEANATSEKSLLWGAAMTTGGTRQCVHETQAADGRSPKRRGPG